MPSIILILIIETVCTPGKGCIMTLKVHFLCFKKVSYIYVFDQFFFYTCIIKLVYTVRFYILSFFFIF